jgi:hypothetical protein
MAVLPLFCLLAHAAAAAAHSDAAGAVRWLQPIGSNMYSLITEGLNHRLHTECTGNSSMHCVMLELGRRNMALAQATATAIPEQALVQVQVQQA